MVSEGKLMSCGGPRRSTATRQAIEAQLDKLGQDAEKEDCSTNARMAHVEGSRAGDFQLACDIVGLSHYPIGHVNLKPVTRLSRHVHSYRSRDQRQARHSNCKSSLN